MPVRSRAVADAQRLLSAALHTDTPEAPRPTSLGADILDHPDFGMLAALMLGGVSWIGFEPFSGYQLWLLDGDGSWACLDAAGATVTSTGRANYGTS